VLDIYFQAKANFSGPSEKAFHVAHYPPEAFVDIVIFVDYSRDHHRDTGPKLAGLRGGHRPNAYT
jgi:hypothetical protein